MKFSHLFIVVAFVASCTSHSRLVVIPPAPVTLTGVVFDITTGLPIIGASCIVDDTIVATTDASGRCELQGVMPSPPKRTIAIAADGYDSYRAQYDVVNAGDVPVALTPAFRHKNPADVTVAELRAQRGAFAGMYIPALAPQCPQDPTNGIKCVADNGATPRGHVNGLIFTANYRIYTDEQRATIRREFKARGYRHFVISLFCTAKWEYHGLFPPCATSAKVSLDDALHELWDDDLIPVGAALDDDEPNDLTTPIGFLSELHDRSLIRVIFAYWEHFQVGCATLKLHQEFPDALLYYHNPSNTDAPYGDACFPGPNFATQPYPGGGPMYAWLHDHAGLTGLLLQTEEVDIPGLVGRIADFTASFSDGPRIGRVGGGWPSGLDVDWFEDIVTVYNNFWSGGDEAANIRRTDQVLKYLETSLCEDVNTRAVVDGGAWCGRLAGFNVGGTIR